MEGLEGGEQLLLSMLLLLLLRRVDDVDLVRVLLGRGLWGHVMDVVDLVMLDRVWPLRGRFCGLRVMLTLVMPFHTPSTLM